MVDNIKPKEATAIIKSLIGGVLPKIGVQHITVGRSEEIKAFETALADVKNGRSIVKFWIGEVGSGKSFMLHLLNNVALKQNFVVAKADFTPNKPWYSDDANGVALYSAIMNNVAIQTKPDGGGLPTLIEKWIEKIIAKLAKENKISLSEIHAGQHSDLIGTNIVKAIIDLTGVDGYDFGMAVMRYYEGYINNDEQLRLYALKWLKGEYTNIYRAMYELGVREIINDTNCYNMLKYFCKLFVSMGFGGLVINLDEGTNVCKISNPKMREKSYERILTIYNDCHNGKINNLLFNFAGTTPFLENERKGLFSYRALKERLETNRFDNTNERDFAHPVVRLLPLNHTEIFVLLEKLKAIFHLRYKAEIHISGDEILEFMEELFNRPGASKLLAPRKVVIDFLNILNDIRRNPGDQKSAFWRRRSL